MSLNDANSERCFRGCNRAKIPERSSLSLLLYGTEMDNDLILKHMILKDQTNVPEKVIK